MSARTLRNAVAAVVLTAAVAAAGTACGGGSDHPEHQRTPAAAEPAAPAPETGKPSAAADAKAEKRKKAEKREKQPDKDGATEAPPTVPKAELTPATGSFTKKQKEYLIDRVPRGTDPAAVLEAGQAVCDRISRTAEVDRKSAISALESGEIADPEAAVTHLCPKHQPLLEAAGLTVG